MNSEDYYTLLGVSEDASTRQIKAAYRRLAFEHHPDRNRDTPGSSEAMKMSGFDLPENGADIRDRVWIEPGLAAAGGPYAYFLRERSKKLVVKIPAGVREGQRIRLAGMGREGRSGGTPGDLFLEVRLRRPILERIKSWAARMFGY